MATQHHAIRRRSSITDCTPKSNTESAIAARATVITTSSPATFAKSPDLLPKAHLRHNGKMDHALRPCADSSGRDSSSSSSSSSPPLYRDAGSSSGGHSRATSSASRKNRLSLTLPIALATNTDLARITQSPVAPASASAAAASIPPTPLDTSNGGTPHTANDFIIAIAAQERRVFELKEELVRAETELARLKKQWTAEEVYRKRSDSQRTDPYRTVGVADDDVFGASRRSIELDRRRLLIQTQQQGSQTPSNRRVLRGSHARTLSLLSPSKADGDSSSLGDESRTESILLPTMEQRAAQIANPHVTKRQSWQTSRSQQSAQASGSNISSIPQMVEDFKYGFRAFVEDIRQITIGDEPVLGPAGSSQQRPAAAATTATDPDMLGSCLNKDQPEESSYASPSRPTASRPRPFSTAADGEGGGGKGGGKGGGGGQGEGGGGTRGRGEEGDGRSAGVSTATQLSKTPESRPRAPGKTKHFSWTPLGVDSFDDTDWSNWDSPEPTKSTKSARWSGSTLDGHGLGEIESASETGEENVFEGPKKSAAGEDPLLSPGLGEILPNAIDRFSPSNFKRAADNFMGEWERSLMPPEDHQGKEIDCP